MKIVVLLKPNNAVDYHRLTLPFENMLWDMNDQVIFLPNDKPFPIRLLDSTDIVIFSRTCPFNVDKILEARKRIGFKIVVDIDDYWYLNENHHLIDVWLADKTSEKTIKSIHLADHVFCTNVQLRDRIAIINKDVSIFKNALPYGEGQFKKGPAYQGGFISFLYVGSITHLQDIRTIEPALKACRNDTFIRTNSMLKLAGYSNTKTWNRILNVVKEYGDWGFLSVKPISSYMDAYDHGNVCIAPLANNEFNTFKSTLKIVEAGCKSRPIICSDMAPYSEDRDCPGVILCKTSRDWYEAIEDFVRNPHKINELGHMLHKYVNKKYSLSIENIKRHHLFKQIIAE